MPHGLRSTFRDWAAERTDHPREMAELALTHDVGSEIDRAYRRSDMVERRREMMGRLARFLSSSEIKDCVLNAGIANDGYIPGAANPSARAWRMGGTSMIGACCPAS